ncbi:ubiquitin carboxyl-terminal hydrolase 48 [Entomortierella parvispora]|uniref:ubiquitinyl hydrolase 1 n=1 Tax=Entomortierella parvispora TaxID=205924 RepID=A0A9P3HKY0_9FUNG|nr:ubiquitin carboxyl-terminal hydrolase 48 [Entomortierella parvispora]
MPPVSGKRGADRRYGFVGTEVKSIEDFTPAHLRRVYFLQPIDDSHSEDESISNSTKDAPSPYCGNKYSEPPTVSASCSPTCSKEGNPQCLNYLGQDQWEKEDAAEKYCSPDSKKDNPLLDKRIAGTSVGLKNLGATCYANASLQVWFHDPAFRDCIYQCVTKPNTNISKDALHQLQSLFAHMDKGKKNSYSPLSLVECLGLNMELEQDAQEFGSLLMSKIDSELQQQDNGQLRTFIKDHFQGNYNYSTTCKKCKTTSIRPCPFFELSLNIDDHWTLKDCLDDLLKPEKLVGDDRYFCSVCQSLQNATREIKFDNIPEVLNVQLMRFKYDSETWTKEKSFDKVLFPESIDVSRLVGSTESQLYDLSAVLVHSGESVETGHYLAYVLHPESKKWFICNDESVLEFSSTKFDPVDYVEPKKTKPKAKKQKVALTEVDDTENIFSSRNAYMLSYTRRVTKRDVTTVVPVDAVMSEVLNDNDTYQAEIDSYMSARQAQIQEFEKRRSVLRELYRIWSVDDDKGYYVPQELLTQILALKTESDDAMESPPPPQITCKHRKLCPKTVVRSKRVSESAYSILIKMGLVDQYSILTTDDLCTECAKDQVQDRLYAIEHKRDVDEFDRKVRYKGPKNAATNWISRAWVTEWSKVTPRFHKEHTAPSEDASPISDAYLPDVICPHSCLAVDRSKRRQINNTALSVLERVFGQLDILKRDVVECAECRDDIQPLLDDKKDTAARAAYEKQELSEYLARGPRVRDMLPLTKYYLVSQGFMKAWVDFIRKPTVAKRPEILDNDGLLCEHGLLTYDLEEPVDYKDVNGFVVLLDDEWTALSNLYEGGKEVIYVKPSPVKPEEDDISPSPTTPVSTPVCEECRNKRILDFSSANIIVRVYPPGEPIVAIAESPLDEDLDLVDAKANNGYHKRKSPSSVVDMTGSRRSRRSKSSKDPFTEHKVVVNKQDTVMDLKVKIMQKTAIVPLYQKLMLGDLELDENEKTIEGLEIAPNTILNLITFDEDSEEVKKRNEEERKQVGPGGFSGTGLTGNWS